MCMQLAILMGLRHLLQLVLVADLVLCSQQIKFGLQNPQDIINCGVFHVYERSLYKMPERIPHPNGVLDQRLVSSLVPQLITGFVSSHALAVVCALKDTLTYDAILCPGCLLQPCMFAAKEHSACSCLLASAGYQQQGSHLQNLWSEARRLRRSLCLLEVGASSVSYWLLQEHSAATAVHL